MDDLMQDPNMVLAVAMFKTMAKASSEAQSIENNLITQAPIIERASSQQQPPALVESKASECIEVSPVSDLVDKLREKTVLSKDELNAITMVMTTEIASDPKKFLNSKEAGKLNEFLWLAYFSILNAHSFTHCQSFIESQAVLKLTKETILVIKNILEILTPKKIQATQSDAHLTQTSASLFNSFLPPALKILGLFSSSTKDYYDQMHYKYLRVSHIKLECQNLSSLNSVFMKLAPKAFGGDQGVLSKKSQQSDDIMIPLSMTAAPKVATADQSDEDFMQGVLDFIPQDYQIMAKSLHDQLSHLIAQEVDETMSMVGEGEEEKTQVESFETSVKDHIHKLKVIDLLSKSIDRLVTLATSEAPEDFMFILDSKLFSILSKSTTQIQGFKPKSFSNFIGKVLSEKTIKAQSQIIEQYNKLKDIDRIMAMEIDQIVQSAQGSEVELKAVQENVTLLAKCLEIIQQVQGDQADISEIISQSENLWYLTKLVKTNAKHPKLTELIEAIALQFCKHFKHCIEKEDYIRQITHKQSVSLIACLTKLTLTTRALNDFKAKDVKKVEEVKINPPIPSFSIPLPILGDQKATVRTRSQLKKEHSNASTAKNQNANKKGEKKGKTENDTIPQFSIIKVDASDLLKSSLSLLASVIPLYIKTGGSNLIMTGSLLKNLFRLAPNNSDVISHLVVGLLAQFTRPDLIYSQDSIQVISNFIVSNANKFTHSNMMSIVAIKFLFLLSNAKLHHHDASLAQNLAVQLVQNPWSSKKTGTTKFSPEFIENKSLGKFFLYLSAIIVMSGNQRASLVGEIMKNFEGDSILLKLCLLKYSLLHTKSVSAFKPSVSKFVTQLFTDKEQDPSIVRIASDTDKIVQDLFYSPNDRIYDPQLIQLVQETLTMDSIIIKILPIACQIKASGECKQFVNSVLKQVAKINAEISGSSGEIDPDLETYIGIEVSQGRQNILLMNASYSLGAHNRIQDLVRSISTQHGDDDLALLRSYTRSLQYVSKTCQQQNIEVVRDHLMKNKSTVEAADAIMDMLKVLSHSNKLKTLVQQIFSTTLQPQELLIGLVVDPQAYAKNVSSHKPQSQKLEDMIYSHCFSVLQSSQDGGDTLQQFTSNNLLLRILYGSLGQVVESISDREDESLKTLRKEIAHTLLECRQENSILDYSESGSNSFELNIDKVVAAALYSTEVLTAKDYFRIRTLDSSISSIASLQNLFDVPRNALASACNEIAASTLQFQQIKMDLKLYNAYFQLQPSALAEFFKVTMKCHQHTTDIPALLWNLAFKYLQLSSVQSSDGGDESSQVSRENKGGLQMNISFTHEGGARGSKGRGFRGGAHSAGSRRGGMHNKAYDEAHGDEQVVPEQKKPASRQINQVALKLICFLNDAISCEKNTTYQEHQTLCQNLKTAFLRSSNEVSNFIFTLYDTKQIPLLRRLLTALLKDEEQPLKGKIADIVYQSLLSFIHQLDSKQSDGLFLAIEIIFNMSDSNQYLVEFIVKHALPKARQFESENVKGKLIILDLLCQIAQKKFSKIDSDRTKYSALQIQDYRKEEQAKKEVANKKKKDAAALRQEASNQNPDNEEPGVISQFTQPLGDGTIDGLKQEKWIKEQEHDRFMEKPEELCTFTYTQKNFQMQPWYFCYTCRLTDNSGCCAVCVHKCHKGHQVAFSKRSNFFCDCGSSGRCQSVNPSVNASSSGMPNEFGNKFIPKRMRPDGAIERGQKFGEHLIRPSFGQPLPSYYQAPPSMQYGYGGLNPIDQLNGAPNGLIPPPRGMDDISFREILDQQMTSQQMFKQLVPSNPAGLIRSDSSDEEMIIRDNMPYSMHQHFRERMGVNDQDSDEDLDVQERNSRKRGLAQHMMKAMKKSALGDRSIERLMQAGMSAGLAERLQIKSSSPKSLSNVSSVNPLDDPFSDAGCYTPVNAQPFLDEGLTGFSQNLNQSEDAEMSQPSEQIELLQDMVDLVKIEHSHFDEVIAYLINLVSDQASSLSVNEVMGVDNEHMQKKETKSFLDQKHSVTLVGDITQHKRVFNQVSFQVKQHNDINRVATSQNLNLLNIIDSNKDGLVAVCEDQEICLYAGSQFSDEQAHDSNQEQFNFSSKENQFVKLDTIKFSYQPLQVRFNPAQPYFLAVVGAQNLDVLVISKLGKLQYKVSNELLLEAIRKDMTIVNTKWLPGSQSSIAVGTSDFIKIYDLANDTISPTHNIMIFNGFITDFTFGNCSSKNGKAQATLYGASKSGAVFYQNITYSCHLSEGEEKMIVDEDNSDLMMTEAIVFAPQLNIKENTIQCLSIHSVSTPHDYLLITFSEGFTLFGRHDQNTGEFKGQKISVADDPSFNGSNFKTIWQKFGEHIVSMRDIGFVHENKKQHLENRIYLSAFSRRLGSSSNQNGVPLILEISESKVQVNVVKNSSVGSSGTNITPVFGQALVKKSYRQSKVMRLVNIQMDGICTTYAIKALQSQEAIDQKTYYESFVRGAQSSAGGNVDMLIMRSDLPKEVKLSVNYFEKHFNIYSDAGMRGKLSFSGDIVNYFKTSEAAFQKLQNTQPQVVINEVAKKSIKFSMKLDSQADAVITGIRVKVDLSGNRSQAHFPSLKLFNRQVRFQNPPSVAGPPHPLWFEIPFCDAEILFGSASQTNMAMELLTEDPKNSPIRICSMEIFGQLKKDFLYKEKIRRLEKMNMERMKKMQSLEQITSDNVRKDDSIQDEFLRNKGVPIASFKEKVEYLQNAATGRTAETILALDIATQYIAINQNCDKRAVGQLVETLKTILSQCSSETIEKSLHKAAVQRCLRQALQLLAPEAGLGDPQCYKTIKDQMLVKMIENRLQASDLALTEIRTYLRSLMKVYLKRHYQLFKILEDCPLLVPTLVSSYTNRYSSGTDQKEVNHDIQDLVGLVIALYHQQVNSLPKGQSVEQSIRSAYSQDGLSNVFQQLQPLLFNSDEQVQKMTLSCLLSLSAEFSKIMAKSLKLNKLPQVQYGNVVNQQSILIVDFSPHLITYALKLLTQGNVIQKKQELVYQLIFKMMKAFEQNAGSVYQSIFTEYVTQFIKTLITHAVLSVDVQPFADLNNQSYLYSNLILVNLLIQQPMKDTDLKIKGSKLGLTEGSLSQVLQLLSDDESFSHLYIQWAISVLRVIAEQFKSQKCSFRMKSDEGMPGSVYEVLYDNGQEAGQKCLLRPVQEFSSWIWHPLFLKADQQFQLIDRKLPAQILLTIQFIFGRKKNLQQYDASTGKVTELISTIRELALKKPAKVFLKQLGEQSIKVLLLGLNQNNQQEVDKILKHKIKGSVSFEEFYDVYEALFCKHISKKGSPLTYNMQFQLHILLQKTWKKASANFESWQYFINESQPSRTKLFSYLFDSSFILNDDSAQLCLQLCSLAYDQTVILSFKQADNIQINLILVFTKASQPTPKNDSIGTLSIDLSKLIDVMLLGRNKKQLRISAAHLVKGLYDHNLIDRRQLKDTLIERMPLIRTKGVNSQEFIAVLAYIVNRDIEVNGVAADSMLYQRLSKLVYKEIQRTNQQLIAHENLDIYASLQNMTNAFSQSQSADTNLGSEEEILKKLLLIERESQRPSYSDGSLLGSRGQKITNPYMLESEACQKCFAQRSLPFSQQRLNDIKTEAKFTDSTMVYRFNTTYLINQIQIVQDAFRGNKVVKEINVYVNNKQGIDLADMKNNWNHWKKVKSQDVAIGQRQISIDFTLPVNASNLLLEFITHNITKVFNGKDRAERSYMKTQKPGKEKKKGPTIESIHQVMGIDSVLMTLPKRIAAKLGTLNTNEVQEPAQPGEQSAVVDKDQMVCPRCQKVIQGKHGNCNQCGENALQCTYCRNINYEKPDGFICNECGFSRFVKMEFGLVVKQGFATEKIESEEAKAQAINQIDQNLQAAQNSYSQLMKKRQIIAAQLKKINEGGNESGKAIGDMYSEECADLYQKMMKSLNTIKTLKYEIDQYTQGGCQPDASNPELAPQLSVRRSNSSSQNDDGPQEQCFSCIQEYLKGVLSFIQSTSDNLSEQYKKEGFIDLLYRDNLKMYSSQLQDPARRAICSLLKSDETLAVNILKRVQSDLFAKKQTIPAHLLSQNISQETLIILDMLKLQQNAKPTNYFPAALEFMWRVLFQGLQEGATNAAIADQVVGTFFNYIKEQIRVKEDPSGICKLLESLFTDQLEQSSFLKLHSELYPGRNFLISSLTLSSSQKVRNEGKEIISFMLQSNKTLFNNILKQLLQVIDKVVKLDSSSGDQYFDLLGQILSPATIKEKITEESLKKTSESHIYVEAFDLLFKLIDHELNKLVIQENQRLSLGADGFMPQISTGQIFARIVGLVSAMIKESVHLKGIIQNNVSIVIKSFLKIRKLNLTKNKVIQSSEVEIEKMFKELHSQREEERENFILECIKIIESGECDNQEMRFLFEEMCKVIDPVKPEPEYLLTLHKAQSQEFYFRGKMSKNPYLSSQLGKTMADVRVKICKEMELAEPELVELLVAGKLVNMDLSIKQVYEQVHWPAVCKQKNPDIYDIPPIDEAPKSSLIPMTVTFRLMGIDGEATEDRVETLLDGSEGDLDPANIIKKYGITKILCRAFETKNQQGVRITGVKVLLDVLENFGSLKTQRYLAEWLFKMIGYALKLKQNRTEFMKEKRTVDHLAKRLFESVGIQSQIEGQKGVTLFDVILMLLETVVVEVNVADELTSSLSIERVGSTSAMEIDGHSGSLEAAKHTQIFLQILADSCSEMVSNHQSLDKTSKKIKAVSKILPFLINAEDTQAQEVIVKFIGDSLTQIPLLDNLAMMTAKEKFSAQFNIERVIEILDSTPVDKDFLKDKVSISCGGLLESMWTYLQTTTLVDISQEQLVYKHKLANQYTMRLMQSLFKNHPTSQSALFQTHNQVICKMYELTQAKYKERLLILHAQDVVEVLTSKNLITDPQVKEQLQKLIDQQNDDKKKLAQKKKEEIMKQMALKKSQNKFMKQIDGAGMQEELGPKCIVCQEGYTKKPTEVLGMYVFSKKQKISEISPSGHGFTNTQGYTTVTHSNFIHFTCHQNAYRVDSQLKQPKKEWEGAAIRNDHTKCNNLFPLRGGSLPIDSYAQMVERYFQILVKSVGQCDPDRVKVLLHDFKGLMKRFAYEDSFSRDSQGGGPEHNMHLVAFMIQMVHYLLQASGMNFDSSSTGFTYHQEKKISEFIEQGMNQRKDFMQRLEEEKRAEEIEEEEKLSQSPDEDEDSEIRKQEPADEMNEQMSNFSLDQIAFMLSKCVIFCQLPRWETYKQKFFSIILCTVSNMREEKGDQQKPIGGQTDLATGKKVLTIAKQEDVVMVNAMEADQAETGISKRRRANSDNRIEQVEKALFRLRPLLVLMRLVDAIKQKWDAKLSRGQEQVRHDEYLTKLMDTILARGNLKDLIGECDELFHEYKDRVLKLSSVEEFLQEMGMLDTILAGGQQTLEQFILSHF